MNRLPALARIFVLACAALTTPLQAAEAPLVTEAIVNAPVARVWEAFATPAGYASVGGQATVDLKVRGTLTVKGTADAPATVSEILSFEPERLLSTRVTQPPAGFGAVDDFADTWTVVYFTPLGEMTHVRVAGFGFRTGELARFFEQDQSAQLKRIEKLYWPLCALCKVEGK